MKSIRNTRVISLFMACCLLIATFATPVALATTSKNGVVMLETTDWKVVKVNGKKAFNLTAQNFSNAYDTIARMFVEDKDDEYYLLMNMAQRDNYWYSKIDIDGASIDLFMTDKNDASKGKITKINITLLADDSYSDAIYACLLMLFSNYDQDSSLALDKKIKSALNSSKKTTTFSRGNLKYTVKKPDSSYTLLYLTVTPK